MSYLWKGPNIDGISQSMMNDFYICRYRFFLKYMLGLGEEELDGRLVWGDVLHKGLEHYIAGTSYEESVAIMRQYLEDNYPIYANSSYPYSTAQMLKLYNIEQYEKYKGIKTEVLLSNFVTHKGYEYRTRGKVDVLIPGKKVIDHKCKGSVDIESIREELKVDLQLAYYSKLTGVTRYGYDVIAIPEYAYRLPPRRTAETQEGYIDRLFNGRGFSSLDFPIAFKKHRWIYYLDQPRTEEQIDSVWDRTIYPTWEAMREYYEYVTDPSFDYLNPDCYNSTFFQTPVRHFNPILTDKWKGEFHDLLIEKKTLNDYITKETCFPELE